MEDRVLEFLHFVAVLAALVVYRGMGLVQVSLFQASEFLRGLSYHAVHLL